MGRLRPRSTWNIPFILVIPSLVGLLNALNLLNNGSYFHTKQVAQLSQRDRAAGWVSNGQKWKTGTNRKPVCDFLLVINSNYHPISYRFGDIAAYCSNFRYFAFLSHPLGA